MPTVNPRVNVTLSPSLDALVSQMAGLERVSKSSVLRELLEAVEPSLRQAVALMEAAKGASANARKNIVRDMDNSIKAAEAVQGLMLSVAANHTRDMVVEAEAIRGRRPSRSAQRTHGAVPGERPARTGHLVKTVAKTAKRPPLSNRGVK
jgi:hypothetical protein